MRDRIEEFLFENAETLEAGFNLLIFLGVLLFIAGAIHYQVERIGGE